MKRALLLLFFLCSAIYAQPPTITNLHGNFGLGFWLGNTNIYNREAEFKWDPVQKLPLFHNGIQWLPIGAGAGAGFPLTNSPYANTPGSNTSFGVYDFGFLDFLGSTNNLYFNTNQNQLYFGDAPVGSGFGSGFPLTNNANAANFNITNILTLIANHIQDLSYIDFNLAQTNATSVGRLYWDNSKQTLVLGLTNDIAGDILQNEFAFVRNSEDFTINRGTVVYLSGDAGDLAAVRVASYSNDAVSARSFGIAAQDIAKNDAGLIVTRGVVRKLNTAAYSSGSVLWLGHYGNVQTNRPVTPNHGVFIGVVERSNAGNGSIFVAIQNGFELDELHDVLIANPQSGQVLVRAGTNIYWENSFNLTNLQSLAASNMTVRNSFNANGSFSVTNLYASFSISSNNINFLRTTNASATTTLNLGNGIITSSGNGSTFGNTTIANLTVPGNLTVAGTQNVNIVINQTTTINNGTNYIATTIYTTNVSYQETIIITTSVSYVTNNVTTYVNVGGSFTMGHNSIFDATNALKVLFPGFLATNNYANSNSYVTATGKWDFTGAQVSGLGSASITSRWSVLYSDANTNSISLALGASDTVLRSNGTNSAPVWAILDDLSWKLAPISANYTSVSYNFVLADTAGSDIFVTLPSASVNSGKVVAARKMSNLNTLYMKTQSGDMVQGVQTVGVVRVGNVIEVISSGDTNWWLR